MSKEQIREWKNRRIAKTDNPAGVRELDTTEMKKVAGGAPPTYPAPICALSLYPRTRCYACN
ncbi:MAG: hypothetical protein HYX75_16335 [Acidobacteria bacterium]|nr:hypothetical protein [Acidobacteriota bacterium]